MTPKAQWLITTFFFSCSGYVFIVNWLPLSCLQSLFRDPGWLSNLWNTAACHSRRQRNWGDPWVDLRASAQKGEGTCHLSSHFIGQNINKVANGILPQGRAVNLCSSNTVHPMTVPTSGLSHCSYVSVAVHLILDPTLSLRSLHWNPGPPMHMPIRQFPWLL